MRRIPIIIMFVAVALFSVSCHRHKDDSGEESTSKADVSTLAWNKTEVNSLTINPVQKLAKDWMVLATGNSKNCNAMTISWGSMGELWGKPVFIVFVSKDRASKKMMDNNQYFTVSGFPDSRKNRVSMEYLGTHSATDDPNKIANSGLTVEYSENGSPMFKEANLCFECKKLYSDEFTKDRIPVNIRESIYGETGLHTMYIGEIVNVYEKNAKKE